MKEPQTDADYERACAAWILRHPWRNANIKPAFPIETTPLVHELLPFLGFELKPGQIDRFWCDCPEPVTLRIGTDGIGAAFWSAAAVMWVLSQLTSEVEASK